MTPTERRKFIYDSFTEDNQWNKLVEELKELRDAVQIALDRKGEWGFSREDALCIITEFADCRNLMQQITENNPKLAAAISIEQDRKELRTIERIATGYYTQEA